MKKLARPQRGRKANLITYTRICCFCLIILVLCASILTFNIQRFQNTRRSRKYPTLRRQKHTISHSASNVEHFKIASKHRFTNLKNITYNQNKRNIWTVISESGIFIRDALDIYGSNVNMGSIGYYLPRGSILIGQEMLSIGANQELIYVDFPHNGWISTLDEHLAPSIVEVHTDTDVRCHTEQILENTDYRGGDINPFPLSANSPMECCSLCLEASDCFVWTFTPDKSCWLKGALSEQMTMPGSNLKSGNIPGRIAGSHIAIDGKPLVQQSHLPSCCKANFIIGGSDGSGITMTSVGLQSLQSGKVSSSNNYSIHNNMLMRQSRSSLDWIHQWPIGNGRFGLLVGGTFDKEIIPISIADFFVSKADKPKVKPTTFKEKSKSTLFKQAREYLKSGRLDETSKFMQALVENDRLGMFQYIADLSFLFSTDAFVPVQYVSSKNNSGTSDKTKDPPDALAVQQLMQTHQLQMAELQKRPLSKPEMEQQIEQLQSQQILEMQIFQQQMQQQQQQASSAREAVINQLKGKFTDIMELPEMGSVKLSQGVLDMRRGVAHSDFIIELKDNEETEGEEKGPEQPVRSEAEETEDDEEVTNKLLHVHRREWFVSSHYEVAVGHFSCESLLVNGNVSDNDDGRREIGCLNVALGLSRQSGENFGRDIYATVQFSSYAPSSPIPSDSWNCTSDTQCSMYAVDMSVGYRSALSKDSRPKVQLYGVAICNGGSSSIVGRPKDRALMCNNADAMSFVLSPSLLGNNFHKYGTDRTSQASSKASAVKSVNEAKAQAMQSVEAAVVLGLRRLRARHTSDFTSKMDRVQLSLVPASDPQATCPGETIQSRLLSFGSKCLTEEGVPSNSPDEVTLTQAFNFGRYLLLSSASSAVANLQGLWADGPTSAWSGDYHMNINLQMNYWAADVAGLSEVYGPLTEFIDRLAAHGKFTAGELYGCAGWVAHGFTDVSQDAGILGDSQWALCVTCGAWLVTQLWDHLTFSFDSDLLLVHLLPLLRGVADFFLDYMWEDDAGVFHTGPTTSPENSFFLIPEDSNVINQNLNIPFNVKPKAAKLSRKMGNVQIVNQIVKPSPQAEPMAKVLAFSPAIDISILRQTANAFKLAVQWAKSSHDGYDKAQFTKDLAQSNRFMEVVSTMPGMAVPVVDPKTGLVLEYPAMPALARQWGGNSSFASAAISEAHDLGHRHFSSMHWLYPGIHHPAAIFRPESALRSAAVSSMTKKSLDGAGHTSWSAAWQACLWARLGDGGEALKSLSRLLSKYSAGNLLSLHPPLEKVGPESCSTCFRDPLFGSDFRGARSVSVLSRGLTTAEDAKFQIDGNLGLVAAVAELLVQSHESGVLSLLPAAGSLAGGRLKGLRVRGGGSVSMSWTGGEVKAAVVSFDAFGKGKDGYAMHPWLRGQVETSEGFYSMNDVSSNEAIVRVVSPNALQLSSAETACASVAPTSTSEKVSSDRHSVRIIVYRFPCSFVLCDIRVTDDLCVESALEIRN